MKIAVVRQKYVNYGGAEQFVSEYTTHLANAGHSIHIFANQWAPCSHLNIHVHPVRAIKLSSFLRTLSFASFAHQAIDMEQFDVENKHSCGSPWSHGLVAIGQPSWNPEPGFFTQHHFLNAFSPSWNHTIQGK